MIYADFDYYQTVFMGVQITDIATYERYATRAAIELDYYTIGKASKNADLDAVKMAACAVAEQYQIIDKANAAASSEAGELQSESVGSYSRTYRSAADSAMAAKMSIKGVIEHYLAATGLLYRGAPVCIHRTL